MSTEAGFMPRYTPEEAQMLSGLQLAYIGDSVFDLLVRTRILATGSRVHDLHRMATARVNAVSQARALEKLLPRLSPEETAIVRRGRNAHAHHTVPKAATQGDYSRATGLEALLGYLYLTHAESRLCEVFSIILEDELSCPEQT